MGSVAGTGEDLGNNPPQITLCQTIRSDTRTIRPDMYADGLSGWFRACVACGGSDTYLGNSLKMGPTVAGSDGPRSRADGLDMCRSPNLLLICLGGCGCSGYVSIGIP
jgi:hypothetical protein